MRPEVIKQAAHRGRRMRLGCSTGTCLHTLPLAVRTPNLRRYAARSGLAASNATGVAVLVQLAEDSARARRSHERERAACSRQRPAGCWCSKEGRALLRL